MYLPHWSGHERAAARYELEDGRLCLLIEADQPPWCPELDGSVRVSSVQTGHRDGQHRFHPDAVARASYPEQRLHVPRYAHVELRARATDDPDAMVALWMIGFEDEPERSGEICVCEIFGRDVAPDRALVGMGVHPFGDPGLVDEFEQVPLAIDVREPHTYAANWTEERVEFFVDGSCVKIVEQSPSYPMQLMLGIYAFSDAGPYPKTFDVDYVRSSPAIRRRASQIPRRPSASR